MKIKFLALILTLATFSWTQSTNSTAPAAKDSASPPSCACCDKMSADTKNMAGEKVNKTMECCKHHGKEMATMSCCNGKESSEGKACMQSGKDAGNCCSEGAGCCKKHAACCAKKPEAQAAKGCCKENKCDRHAHEHAGAL
jgi:hypothetical protein